MLTTYSGSGDRLIHETENLVSLMERGTSVIKFYPRKRPERRQLSVRRETHQLVWYRPAAGTGPVGARPPVEGAIDIRDIKEVRMGKAVKDIERWPDELRRVDPNKCFTVYYGMEFKLRCAPFSVLNDDEECQSWVKVLLFLVQESRNASYPLQTERWLRKEFYAIENSNEKVTLKDVKAFLPRINCKISTSRLRDMFAEVDTGCRGEIGFDDLSLLYRRLLFDENNVQELMDKHALYCANGSTISLREFRAFLRTEQSDPLGADDAAAAAYIRDYLRDPQRDVSEAYLKMDEFVDLLFSKHNTIWDSRNDSVTQDMTRPLADYWISSSHNTYLMGDQFSSESSLEAYIRCLRAGCRCIELDCWDGPDGMPFVYHGHTLTSKIRFMDVLRTIKEYAFVTSEYPLILSIEDNCSLPQQRRMAAAFQDVFGDALLTAPVDKAETALPSPHALRRKVLLKHKKLPDGGGGGGGGVLHGLLDDAAAAAAAAAGGEDRDPRELDLRTSLKNGILLLEDPVDKEWYPHVFVLTEDKLHYTESCGGADTDTDSEPEAGAVREEELHFGESWFHGRLVGNRREAEQLLRAHAALGDGTFLVRESVTFVGDYCLSFLRAGVVNHCRIKVHQERGNTKFCLIKSVPFDSLYSLITHYRTHTLKSQEFEIVLRAPVPQPRRHETAAWYHARCSRPQAEEALRRAPGPAAFLVRPSERDPDAYAISFRTGREIKHCRVRTEGRLFAVGDAKFESLTALVAHYEKHPLYRKVKLQQPLSEDAARALAAEPDDSSVYGLPGYMDPSSFQPKMSVEALHDYRASRPDELSFCKHAIITNVTADHADWWRGDYGGKSCKWFPANYVRQLEHRYRFALVIFPYPPETDGAAGAAQAQKGMVELFEATVTLMVGEETGRQLWLLRLQSQNVAAPFEMAATSREDALDWCTAIKEAAHHASERSAQNKKMERSFNVAKEMSDLIVYCRSVTFSPERFRTRTFTHNEMSSFPEAKAERLMCQQEVPFFQEYHKHQLSRVYPKGQRIDSSNYNPIALWNAGSQMVALNYQTPDRHMQLNVGRFKENGGCGFVLKPRAEDERTAHVRLRVIAGRHLSKSRRGTASPFVTVEVCGAAQDSGLKLTTRTVADNGINPIWNDFTEFEVSAPRLALLRFLVQDEDVFGDPNFMGQSTLPLSCLRPGYRSVPLANAHSEELELSSLLVHYSVGY